MSNINACPTWVIDKPWPLLIISWSVPLKSSQIYKFSILLVKWRVAPLSEYHPSSAVRSKLAIKAAPRVIATAWYRITWKHIIDIFIANKVWIRSRAIKFWKICCFWCFAFAKASWNKHIVFNKVCANRHQQYCQI